MIQDEQDYIDATNLAKLRIAVHCIRDCLPMREYEKAWEANILLAIQVWTDSLESRKLIAPQPAKFK